MLNPVICQYHKEYGVFRLQNQHSVNLNNGQQILQNLVKIHLKTSFSLHILNIHVSLSERQSMTEEMTGKRSRHSWWFLADPCLPGFIPNITTELFVRYCQTFFAAMINVCKVVSMFKDGTIHSVAMYKDETKAMYNDDWELSKL